MNIILLHGAIGSKLQMSGMNSLLSEEYKVYSFDFPGHGDHPEYEQDFSIEVFENWVSKELDNIDGNIAILGYSLGGYVGLRLALKFPDRVKAVMTFGTIFDWHPAQSNKQISMINPDKIREKVPAFAEILFDTHGEKWVKVLKQTHKLLERLGEMPLLNDDNLPLIKAKCLITVGDRDQLVSIPECIYAYKLIPDGSFAVYANTGHPIEKAPHDKIKKDFLELLSKA